jgi:small-conductance mechanosensitive channel
MLLEDEYGVGDVIDVGPATGEVERVGLRTTRLRAVDGTVWHVRNGEIARVGNRSRDWRRVLLDVAVARGADLAQATRTVRRAAQELSQDERWRPWLLEEPESGAWRGWGRRRPRSGSGSRRVRPSVRRWPVSCGPGWTRRSSRRGSRCHPAPRRRDPTPRAHPHEQVDLDAQAVEVPTPPLAGPEGLQAAE